MALLLLVAGGVVGWLWWDSRPESKLGSADVEFVPEKKPGRDMLPVRRGTEIPWTTYAFDVERTHFAAGMQDLRPPFRNAWMTRIGDLIEFPAVVEGGRVYVTHLRGKMLAMDAGTGEVLWERTYPKCAASSPTIVDQVLYQTFIPTPCNYGPRDVPGLLVAVSARTGKELWRFTGAGPSESSVLSVNGLLYFGSWDGKVYALDPRTQKVRWATQTDDEVHSSAAYSAGRIVVGTNGGSVYALDARTGAEEWRGRSYSRFPHGHEYFYATPAIAYGRVFAANSDGWVYAYGARTGNLIWAQQAGTYVYTAPAVWNGTVYVGSYDGKVSAFDAGTGRLRWEYEAPGALHGAPTVLGGLVYFSVCSFCGSRAVRQVKNGPPSTFALDARTGKLVWRFGAGLYSPIVADGRQVYLMSGTRVWALEPCKRRRTASRTAPYQGLLKTC